MTDVPLQRVRARITVTVAGAFSRVPSDDVRAALARSIRAPGDVERVHLIEVGDVRLLGNAGSDAPTVAAPDSFYDTPSLEALAARQGVLPPDDFDQLLGNFWAAEEDADDVIRVIKSWRRDEG